MKRKAHGSAKPNPKIKTVHTSHKMYNKQIVLEAYAYPS